MPHHSNQPSEVTEDGEPEQIDPTTSTQAGDEANIVAEALRSVSLMRKRLIGPYRRLDRLRAADLSIVGVRSLRHNPEDKGGPHRGPRLWYRLACASLEHPSLQEETATYYLLASGITQNNPQAALDLARDLVARRFLRKEFGQNPDTVPLSEVANARRFLEPFRDAATEEVIRAPMRLATLKRQRRAVPRAYFLMARKNYLTDTMRAASARTLSLDEPTAPGGPTRLEFMADTVAAEQEDIDPATIIRSLEHALAEAGLHARDVLLIRSHVEDIAQKDLPDYVGQPEAKPNTIARQRAAAVARLAAWAKSHPRQAEDLKQLWTALYRLYRQAGV